MYGLDGKPPPRCPHRLWRPPGALPRPSLGQFLSTQGLPSPQSGLLHITEAAGSWAALPPSAGRGLLHPPALLASLPCKSSTVEGPSPLLPFLPPKARPGAAALGAGTPPGLCELRCGAQGYPGTLWLAGFRGCPEQLGCSPEHSFLHPFSRTVHPKRHHLDMSLAAF